MKTQLCQRFSGLSESWKTKQAGVVSFDLYVFDLVSSPASTDELVEMVEQDDGEWGHPLSPKLASFVAELKSAHSGLDVDPDGSPWSSWPLEGNSMIDGRGCDSTFVGLRLSACC